MSVCSVTGTWSHLRLSHHTLRVQTLTRSVNHALRFPSGPRIVRIPEGGREYMLSSLWFGLGLYAFGMNRSIHLAPLCVTVTARVHAVVCYYSSTSERVSCRSCSSCQSVNNIQKLTIPLPFCFSSPSLKPASADTPSRFPPFPFLIIFWVFGSLAFSLFLDLFPSLTLLELANSSNGSCNRRSASAAPHTRRNNK